jgi:hypothetical protein
MISININDEISKKGDNECSLEQSGVTKSKQFVYDSNRERRGHDRLVARSTTTCAIISYHL